VPKETSMYIKRPIKEKYIYPQREVYLSKKTYKESDVKETRPTESLLVLRYDTGGNRDAYICTGDK